MKYAQALDIARPLIQTFTPYCERIEIAGSLRREKSDVNDIEIVCQPILTLDLFGAPAWGACTLDMAVNDMIRNNRLANIKNGLRYKQFLTQGIKLDLFIVRPPAQWGIIFTIRTGPTDFSRWVVTKRQKGGALPSHAKVKDGAVRTRNNTIIPMPEEIDFLNFLNLGWIEPKDRRAKWPQ